MMILYNGRFEVIGWAGTNEDGACWLDLVDDRPDGSTAPHYRWFGTYEEMKAFAGDYGLAFVGMA